jgi:hypothetical protein
VTLPWYEGLQSAFARAFPEDEAVSSRQELPEPFYLGLVQALPELDQEPDVDVVHPVEYNGRIAFLIARASSAWLVWFRPPDATSVLLLSGLRGGRYEEQITIDERGGARAIVAYQHGRLGQPLQAAFPLPARREDALASDQTDDLVARGTELRETLRSWS